MKVALTSSFCTTEKNADCWLKGIGAYIDEYNSLKEKEFLLARNLEFVITKAYKKGATYNIEMELKNG